MRAADIVGASVHAVIRGVQDRVHQHLLILRLRGREVLDTLLFMMESLKLAHKSRLINMMIYDVKNDPILQVSSQEPSKSTKYDKSSC